MSLKFSAGFFTALLAAIAPAWAGDRVEIYHDLDKPANQKFLAFNELGRDVTEAFFTTNTLQAELSLALDDKFQLKYEGYRKYDSSGGIADSVLRAQQEFNLFIDNSKLPGILATIINNSPTIDNINYNFYQKLTAYHPADNRHRDRPPHGYIPSATLNAHYSFSLNRNKTPVFTDGYVRNADPLILKAYYISRNEGWNNVPLYTDPPPQEDSLVLGLVNKANEKVSFIQGRSIYKITVRNVGYATALKSINPTNNIMHSDADKVKCLLGHYFHDQPEEYRKGFTPFKTDVTITTRQPGKRKIQFQSSKIMITMMDAPLANNDPEYMTPEDFGQLRRIRGNDPYALGRPVHNNPTMRISLDQNSGLANYESGMYSASATLSNPTPMEVMSPGRVGCYTTNSLPSLINDAVINNFYFGGPLIEEYGYRDISNPTITLSNTRGWTLHADFTPRADNAFFAGSLPQLNRVEQIIFATLDNYRYTPTRPTRPQLKITRRVVTPQSCAQSQLATDYALTTPPRLAADINYYDIDLKQAYTTPQGARKTSPWRFPVKPRFMYTRTVQPTNLNPSEQDYLRDSLTPLWAAYAGQTLVFSAKKTYSPAAYGATNPIRNYVAYPPKSLLPLVTIMADGQLSLMMTAQATLRAFFPEGATVDNAYVAAGASRAISYVSPENVTLTTAPGGRGLTALSLEFTVSYKIFKVTSSGGSTYIDIGDTFLNRGNYWTMTHPWYWYGRVAGLSDSRHWEEHTDNDPRTVGPTEDPRKGNLPYSRDFRRHDFGYGGRIPYVPPKGCPDFLGSHCPFQRGNIIHQKTNHLGGWQNRASVILRPNTGYSRTGSSIDFIKYKFSVSSTCAPNGYSVTINWRLLASEDEAKVTNTQYVSPNMLVNGRQIHSGTSGGHTFLYNPDVTNADKREHVGAYFHVNSGIASPAPVLVHYATRTGRTRHYNLRPGSDHDVRSAISYPHHIIKPTNINANKQIYFDHNDGNLYIANVMGPFSTQTPGYGSKITVTLRGNRSTFFDNHLHPPRVSVLQTVTMAKPHTKLNPCSARSGFRGWPINAYILGNDPLNSLGFHRHEIGRYYKIAFCELRHFSPGQKIPPDDRSAVGHEYLVKYSPDHIEHGYTPWWRIYRDKGIKLTGFSE